MRGKEIGLVPAGGAVELRQDLALLGCEMMAAGTPVAVEGLREVRRRARLINLAIAPEYEDLFVHNLKLQPSD